MRAAIDGVDVVREAEHRFAIGIVVLQRHFHGQHAVRQIALAFDENRLVVQHAFAFIQVLDELGDAADELELGNARRILALVGQRDFQALVQERQLAQPRGQGVEVELGRVHDGRIGFEGDLRAGLASGFAGLRQRRLGNAAWRIPAPRSTSGFALRGTPDLELQQFRKRVHAAHAHAMQSAGDFVGVGIELAAGVQLGHHHLRGRHALFFVHIHRNAAAVVDHRHRIVFVNGDVDFGGITGQRFVDGVIDDFVDQVMQPGFAGRADVHGGPQAHGLEALQHFNTGGIVNVGIYCGNFTGHSLICSDQILIGMIT